MSLDIARDPARGNVRFPRKTEVESRQKLEISRQIWDARRWRRNDGGSNDDRSTASGAIDNSPFDLRPYHGRSRGSAYRAAGTEKAEGGMGGWRVGERSANCTTRTVAQMKFRSRDFHQVPPLPRSFSFRFSFLFLFFFPSPPRLPSFISPRANGTRPRPRGAFPLWRGPATVRPALRRRIFKREEN